MKNSKFPMPIMRSAAPKTFKRGGMVVNPTLDMDNIDSGASDDEGNQSKLNVKSGSVSPVQKQPGAMSPEAQIFNGLRKSRAPMKVTNGPKRSMKPMKDVVGTPSSKPMKDVVKTPSSKPMKTVVGMPSSKPMGTKVATGKVSNGGRGRMTPKAMRKRHSALYGG